MTDSKSVAPKGRGGSNPSQGTISKSDPRYGNHTKQLILVEGKKKVLRKYATRYVSPSKGITETFQLFRPQSPKVTVCRSDVEGRHLLKFFYNKKGERNVICERCKKFANIDNPTPRATKRNKAFRSLARYIIEEHKNALFNLERYEI